jgi:hypothetical protein
VRHHGAQNREGGEREADQIARHTSELAVVYLRRREAAHGQRRMVKRWNHGDAGGASRRWQCFHDR